VGGADPLKIRRMGRHPLKTVSFSINSSNSQGLGPMHHFAYRNGILHAEDVDLTALGSEVPTPFYVYSTATLERHYRVLEEALAGLDHMICYSAKANSNIAVLKTLGGMGAGLDIVSHGELHRAQAADVPTERIVYSGVGKTRAEMTAALAAGIYCFNVESQAELEALSSVATELGQSAPVALRINPDVDARTHHKISTGRAQDKFGIPWGDASRLYALAATLPGIRIAGIDMHIGSQITELGPYERAFGRLGELVATLRAEGHEITHVDLGGGLGIPYAQDDELPPHPRAYAETIKTMVAHLNCKIIIEPGRMIAGNAGILVARVIYIKPAQAKSFVIVDAAMNDLVRPTLYDAHHEILPVSKPLDAAATMIADIVGPICETGDFLAKDREVPHLAPNDLIAIMSAGAYGAVLSNSYNSRPLVAEVLVKDDQWSLIRPRQTYEAMLGAETLADWQG
jgi:diaminopimelate decarboxylase